MSAATSLPSSAGPHPPGWEASLELGFERRDGVNTLVRRRHRGPLRVQRPFHPDQDGPCQVIVLHPPGGIVGGDRLCVDIRVGEQAEALVTTPGATKFYRSLGATAHQVTRLRVEPGGLLEWLPQETLVFDGVRARIETRVDLAAGARFLGCEITGLGLPASGRPFERGQCQTHWQIWRDDQPIWIDRARLCGGDERLKASWGLAGYSVTGSLVFTGGEAAGLAAVRACLAEERFDGRVAATLLGEVLICRALANSTRHVLDLFSAVRNRLRCDVLGAPASPPRIWAT